jgi:bifunctional DNase/RNase
MVEVKIESIRVSLMSQYRVVILKDAESNRYLPIWIGPYEADAITIHLQDVQVPRPLTHDLIIKVIDELGAKVERVIVSDLHNDTFYARIILTVSGKEVSIDARPSDAIAVAVRAECSIYVEDDVMDRAGVVPEEEATVGDEDLGAFKDFIGSLDLDDLEKNQ